MIRSLRDKAQALTDRVGLVPSTQRRESLWGPRPPNEMRGARPLGPEPLSPSFAAWPSEGDRDHYALSRRNKDL